MSNVNMKKNKLLVCLSTFNSRHFADNFKLDCNRHQHVSEFISAFKDK